MIVGVVEISTTTVVYRARRSRSRFLQRVHFSSPHHGFPFSKNCILCTSLFIYGKTRKTDEFLAFWYEYANQLPDWVKIPVLYLVKVPITGTDTNNNTLNQYGN